MTHLKQTTLLLLILAAIGCPALAQEPPTSHISFPIGVTQDGEPIPAWLPKEGMDIGSPRKRILLVAGLDDSESTEPTARAVSLFAGLPDSESYSLAAILDANPSDHPAVGFPPKGRAYNDKTNPAAIYLWRFIGTYGPDLVIDLRPGGDTFRVRMGRRAGGIDKVLAKALGAQTSSLPDNALASALWRAPPAQVGTVPAIQLETGELRPTKALQQILPRLNHLPDGGLPHSPARLQLQARSRRKPLDTARILAATYGNNPAAQYIPALSLVGRLRLAELTSTPAHQAAVASLLQPYANAEKNPLGRGVSGVNLAGHLAIAELAFRENNAAHTRLVEAAAQRAHQSRKSPQDPVSGHNQMSDSVFMVCPILAAAHALTGKPEYLEDCRAHLRYIQKHCLRKDGLYRHSPQDQAAWGRGNGFPALGLALTLSYLPEDAPGRDEFLQTYRRHMAALLRHQDATGMWHQVIDHPESYREMTATCMTTFAMARGVRKGWLEETVHRPSIHRAWTAINQRVNTDGRLIDVCTGTGKQKNLRAYLDRTAILGKDSRGGAMALLASTEFAAMLATAD